jgi:putative peptidoglycan lipid II flippase
VSPGARRGASASGSYTRAVEERGVDRRLAWSTAVFSLATGLSRILGLVREIVVRRYFGVDGPGINAFTVAFQVPNLVRALAADAALSAAFVPVFSELLEKGERVRAWRVASTLFWLVLLALGGLTALLMLVAPLVIEPFDVTNEDLAVTLARILFPIVTLLGLFGIVVGILNSYEHFSVPALTPVFWNLAIIIGIVVGVPRAGGEEAELYVYAGSILAGTVIQVLLPLPWLRGRDDRLRVAVDWHDPAVRRVLVLMGPMTIGIGLINFNAIVGTLFASRVIDPNVAPAAIDAAFRIYMLPQGMFSVAVATVLFPKLSRLAARDDVDAFRETVSLGLRQITFLLAPMSVLTAVLAEPMIRLLYERGEFDPHETTVVAGALAAFSLGLVFNGMMLMLNRGFFGLQSPWTPTAVAFGNLLFSTALFAGFTEWRKDVWVIPLGISLANIAGAAALLVLLRRRIERVDFGRTARTLWLVTVASAVLAVVAYGLWYALDDALGRSFAAQAGSLGTAVAGGLLAYLISSRLLGVRELEPLLSLRARLRRR